MKKKIINPINNWAYWTEVQKKELETSQNQKSVGDKIVFENEAFKIWSIHLPPNHRLPFHKHSLPYFWTCLTSGASLSYYNNASVIESHYEPGTTKYFPNLNSQNYFIHDLKNIGDTMLIFTTVEFLK